MQFGAGMFNPAEENFWRIVKLERSYAEVEGSRLDLQHTEAWLYLSRLRLGRSDKAAEPKSTNSLLYLLSGQISAEDFAAALTDAYFAQLDQLAASLPAPAVVKTQDGQSVTIGTRIERPARDAVERPYSCLANFMLAEQALGFGKVAHAKALFGIAVDIGADSEVAHYISRTELMRLG